MYTIIKKILSFLETIKEKILIFLETIIKKILSFLETIKEKILSFLETIKETIIMILEDIKETMKQIQETMKDIQETMKDIQEKMKKHFTIYRLHYLVIRYVLVVVINIIIHYLVWQVCLEIITEYRFVVVGNYSLKTVFLLPKVVLRIHIIFIFLLGVLLILKLLGVNRIKLLWVHKIKLIGVSRIKKLDNIEVTNVFKSLVFLNTIINMYLLYHIISIGYIFFTLSGEGIEVFQSMFYNWGTLEVYRQPTTGEKQIYFTNQIYKYAVLVLETTSPELVDVIDLHIHNSNLPLYGKVEFTSSILEIDALVLESHEQVEELVKENVDNCRELFRTYKRYIMLTNRRWWWPFPISL